MGNAEDRVYQECLEFISRINTQNFQDLHDLKAQEKALALQDRFPEHNFYFVADSQGDNGCFDFVSCDHVSPASLIYFGSHFCAVENTVEIPIHLASRAIPEELIQLLRAKLAKDVGSFSSLCICSPKYLIEAERLESIFSTRLISPFDSPEPSTLVAIVDSNKNSAYSQMARTFYFKHNVLFVDEAEGSVVQLGINLNAISRRLSQIEMVKSSTYFGFILNPNFKYPDGFLSSLIGFSNRAGKIVRVFSIGKLKLEKLANFSEIEAFVSFGCPLSIFAFQDLHVPFISCFEFLLSFQEQWSGEYSIFLEDSIKLLDLLSKHSFDNAQSTTEVATRDHGTLLASNRLQSSTYKGLHYDSEALVQDVIHKGAHGYSLKYDYENKLDDQ